MSNYTKTTNFATKDSLASGNPNKIVKGTEINSEFDNIATAVATKANTASPSLTGTVTAAALNVTGNLDVDGTLEFDSISGTGSVAVTDIADEDNMSSNSATKLATQQSIKAYVDSQVTAQDLDLTDGSTSISIDLDSEALSVLGGTGVTSTASGNGVTLAIDSTVTTLTGSQTLTNKTLTSPDVNTPDIDGGTIDGTVIGGATAAAGSFTTVGATGNITVGGTVDGRDVATDGTKLDTIETSATADQTDAEIRAAVEAATDSNVFTDADHSKLNAIEASADVTDTTNVTAAGALMDSELTAIASVKALNQGVATGDSPTFAALTSTGEITANGGIALGDSDKATFGASDDLEIYHDGSHSRIEEVGTGDLTIRASSNLFLQSADNENYLKAVANGATTIYHNNVAKLATTATGIDVTGTATMDGLTVEQNIGSKITLSSTDVAIATSEVIGEIDFYSSDASGIGAASRANISAIAADAAGAGDVYIKTSTGGAAVANRLKIASNGDISFYEDTGTTPKLFWDASAESLGIGTSSPASVLDVRGARPDLLRLYSTAAGGDAEIELLTLNSASTVGKLSKITATQVGADTNGSILAFSTSPTSGTTPAERMRIDSSGNVSVLSGDISLAAGKLLKYSATSYITPENNVSGAEVSTAGVFSVKTGTTPAERMRIDSSGNLLVGTTSSFGGLINVPVTTSDEAMVTQSDSTSSSIHFNFRNPNGFVGSISTSGSATTYATSSDQRLKENIADADDAGSKIDSIQVRKYDWKADGSHQDYGMIAQELQLVAPEAVSGDADSEEMMGVDYSKLVPMLIKEIQSLRNRVAQLEE